MRLSCAAVLALSLAGLGGCLEVAADGRVATDGTAVLTVEFGVSDQLVALIGSSSNGRVDVMRDCERPVPAANLPDGVRSMSGKLARRADLVTCTVQLDIVDPVAFVRQAERAKAGLPTGRNVPAWLAAASVSLEPIGDRAYAFRARPGIPSGGRRKVAPAADMLMAAMTANRYVSLSIAAQRIENSNGELQDDGRRVTWKLPLTGLLQPVPDLPEEFRADIVYRLTFFERAWRFFGL